ncbi:MAG: site-2 protease family protein [Candidatus Dormiibacterota bacterium]
MNRDGVHLARIAGIRISADWSVLVIGALLAWGVAGGAVPLQVPGTPVWLAWIVGVIAATLLIVSLVAHELGHALLARRRGVTVKGIKLWLFGGAAQMSGDLMTGRTEMLVAAIGPAITFVLAGAFFGSSWLLVQIGAPPLVIVVTEWLAAVNLALLLFNLIPAFPLDGGRILRGFLWTRTKNRMTATVAAARAGRFFAMAVIGLGVLDLFFVSPVGGLWLVLIGWFLASAARGEATGEQARHALEGVLVGDVMSKNPVIVPSWITVELLVEQYVMGHDFTSFPTHSIDGRIDGLVTMRGIKLVPPQQRSNRRAIDIAIPADRVPIARQDEPVTDLLKRIGTASDGRAMVYDGGTLVGIVSPSDIARLFQSGPGRVSATAAA